MPAIGGPQHEATLLAKVRELEKEGWRVIVLHGKSPDAIAIKNGKVVAVEAVQKVRVKRVSHIKEKGRFRWKHQGGWTIASKKSLYHMFDDVIFAIYYKEQRTTPDHE